jgi:hypothetical protein
MAGGAVSFDQQKARIQIRRAGPGPVRYDVEKHFRDGTGGPHPSRISGTGDVNGYGV